MARYILFHKPYGVLSQFTPEPGTDHRTLKEFIPIPNVYPVGRLDHDSEGLLLLSDDGAFQHRLSDPRHEHPRTYWAQVERIPSEEAVAKLGAGLLIRDYRTRPAVVHMLPQEPILPARNPPIRYRKSVPTAWLELELKEGRNRQVRRMTASVGHPTLRLVRIAIGLLRVDLFEPGLWRDLTPEEVRRLQKTSP